MKSGKLLKIGVFSAVIFIFNGCGIEEPLERFQFEPRPWTSRMPAAFYQVELKKSTSADVLTFIKSHKKEYLVQSESVVGSWSERKKTCQYWMNAVAFDDESFTAQRKYFLTVDEKPWHPFAERQKLRFDAWMVFPQEVLEESYPSESARRIALLKKTIEYYRDDMVMLRREARVIDSGSMLVNQVFSNMLYQFEKSPSFTDTLASLDGVWFDHITLNKGRVRMVEQDGIVKVKIKIGPYANRFQKHKDVRAMLLDEPALIEIASKKAKRHIDTAGYNAIYDFENELWEAAFEAIEAAEPKQAEKLQKELKGKNYRTVVFMPKEETAETGNLWVFINSADAEVITAYQEK